MILKKNKDRRMKIVKRFLSVMDTLITLTLVFFALTLLGPMIFGIHASIVMSDSMHGTYDAGDLCYIDYNDTNVEVGDIICYSLGEELITHRIISTTEECTFITKGDNNTSPDFAPVSQEQIRGTVKFWIPYLGMIITWIKTTAGVITLISLVGVYMLLSYIGHEILQKKNIWN